MAKPVTTPTPTPTPAPTPTSEPKTAVVTEGQTPATANVKEKSGPANLDTLSVSEKQEYLRILSIKEEQGILSVAEKEAFNNIKNDPSVTSDTNPKEGSITNKDGDENEDPDPEKKGPFKEGDIIKYMYEDWLIGGANWLYQKCAVKLEKGYYSAQRLINERRRQKQLAKGKTDSTQDTHNLITDHACKSGEKNEELIGKHREKQLNNIELLRQGKFEEAKKNGVSNLTIVLMQNMDPKERETFSKVAVQQTNNFYDNMEMAERFATNYARAGMTFDIAKDPDFYKNNPEFKGKNLTEIFELQKRKAMILFARKLDQEAQKGNDPQKLAAKLFKSSENAVEAADKTVDKGKYKEKGKKPKSSLAEEINFISDNLKTVATPEPGQQRGFLETAIADQNFDKSANLKTDEVSQSTAALIIKREENEGRRSNLADLKQKLGITDENIDALAKVAQTQQANAERAKREADGRNMNAGGAALLGMHMNGGGR